MLEDTKSPKDESDEEGTMTEEQRAYMKEMLLKLMAKGIFVVYGDEEKTEETVIFNDGGRKQICKAVCCSFIFALTKADVAKGVAKWNTKQPYFIAREEDGYCPHLNRETFACSIWDDRPERCRNYDCRKDPNVWEEWESGSLDKKVFDHLN
jgi:hypothetical protein